MGNIIMRKRIKKKNKLSINDISKYYIDRSLVFDSNAPWVFFDTPYVPEDIDETKPFKVIHNRNHSRYNNYLSQDRMYLDFESFFKRGLHDRSVKSYYKYTITSHSYNKSGILRLR
jgi:hypothetical protein